jgi:hypothetical protein
MQPKPLHEQRLRLSGLPSPRRKRSPPQPNLAMPEHIITFFLHAPDYQSLLLFYDTPYTIQARRGPQVGHTRLHATQEEEA